MKRPERARFAGPIAVAAIESHGDFSFGDGDVARHVDKTAEDSPCLGVLVARHTAGHQAISPDARTSSAIAKPTLIPTGDDGASRWKKRAASAGAFSMSMRLA
jgi:hypothetical protein